MTVANGRNIRRERRQKSGGGVVEWSLIGKWGGKQARFEHNVVVEVIAGNSARNQPRSRAAYAERKWAGIHKALADARTVHKTDAGVYRAVRR